MRVSIFPSLTKFEARSYTWIDRFQMEDIKKDLGKKVFSIFPKRNILGTIMMTQNYSKREITIMFLTSIIFVGATLNFVEKSSAVTVASIAGALTFLPILLSELYVILTSEESTFDAQIGIVKEEWQKGWEEGVKKYPLLTNEVLYFFLLALAINIPYALSVPEQIANMFVAFFSFTVLVAAISFLLTRLVLYFRFRNTGIIEKMTEDAVRIV